ncbi:MAG: hypothetical protein AB1938_22070 [Myxococcota bacterium]
MFREGMIPGDCRSTVTFDADAGLASDGGQPVEWFLDGQCSGIGPNPIQVDAGQGGVAVWFLPHTFGEVSVTARDEVGPTTSTLAVSVTADIALLFDAGVRETECLNGIAVATSSGGSPAAAFNADVFQVFPLAVSSYGQATVFMGPNCTGDAGIVRFANGQAVSTISVLGAHAGETSFDITGTHLRYSLGGFVLVLLPDGGQCANMGNECTSSGECCSGICMPDGMGGAQCQ